MVKGNKEKKVLQCRNATKSIKYMKQFFMAALNAFMDLISVVTLSIKLFQILVTLCEGVLASGSFI